MAKPKKARPADAPVLLKVDPKLRARWQDAQSRLEAATKRGASAFDARYEVLDEILSAHPPLYLAGGFSTDKAFLASLGETPRDVRRNVRIAHFASPAEEAEYGPTKLDAALSLLEARAGGKPFGRLPVAFDRLRVPTKEGAKSLHDASLDELRTATRALTKPAARQSGDEVSAVLAVLRSAGLKPVRVRFAGGHFTLTNVAPDMLRELGRALAGVKVPKASGEKSGTAKGKAKGKAKGR